VLVNLEGGCIYFSKSFAVYLYITIVTSMSMWQEKKGQKSEVRLIIFLKNIFYAYNFHSKNDAFVRS